METFKLFDYQQRGVDFLISHPRAILGDDMGLGKTLQSISLADKIEAKKILVLAPKALLFSWAHEIGRFSKDSNYSIAIGTKKQKQDALLLNTRWYLTNHETLIQKDIKFLNHYDLIVVDEFHNYMNRKAKKTLALKKLKSNRLIGLTGTPILTKPDQLWSQLNIINPKEFRSYWNWVSQYCEQKPNFYAPQSPIIDGVLNVENYKKMLNPYFLRRTKEEVLPDLPDKIYKEIPLKMSKEQSKLYESMLKEMFVENEDNFHKAGTPLEKLIRLRQLCLDPRLIPELGSTERGVKTDALLDVVTSTDQQIVIFTSFKTYANLLAAEFKTKKISYELLTGDTSTEERAKQLDRFREGKSQIFIGTIKAGGVGLNLQTASILIFTDKDYSPAINSQTESRIHRIGQKKNSTIIDMFMIGSIEELMNKMLIERAGMIDSVITANDLMNKL